MSSWKVILATLVIFTAGLFTGGALVSRFKHPKLYPARPAQDMAPGLPILNREFLLRMEKDLELTRTQRERIENILRDSRERTAILWKLLEPEWREELRHVTGQIREELGPDQRARFEELLKRPRRVGEMPAPDGRRLRAPGDGPSPQPGRPLAPDDQRRLPPNRPRGNPRSPDSP